MSELPIQTNSHIFTNKNGNTLMREFMGIFSKSRHLYDLAQSMSTDIAIRAIINNELWNIAHHHRDLFTSMSEVDYTPDIRKCIKLLPLNEKSLLIGITTTKTCNYLCMERKHRSKI